MKLMEKVVEGVEFFSVADQVDFFDEAAADQVDFFRG